jgi:large-conductance mechanosensitive channel
MKVNNTIPQFGDYFDYFYYLMENDLECYNAAISNASFLFPCSFLTNHFSKNRVRSVVSKMINQSIEDIKQINLSFVIDNTLFPYPNGAYSYSNINVDIETIININVSSSY